jgi:hypothetical protein
MVLANAPVQSTQMLPHGCPVTPKRLWEWLYPIQDTTSIKEIDVRQMEWLTYCLMDHIEHEYGPLNESDFLKNVKLLCNAYSALGYKDWNFEECKNDKKALFDKLKFTLAGQRYLKFPRASMTPQGAIKLRFPEPSVYGLSTSQIIIDSNHPRFGHHMLACQNENRTNNEEFVEISKGRHGDFDWDMDYWVGRK